MEGQSSLRKQAKFRRRILQSPMPNEHPAFVSGYLILLKNTFTQVSVKVMDFILQNKKE